jgi:hypothetical protein
MPTFYVVQKRGWFDKATGRVKGRSFTAKDREAAMAKVQRLADRTGKEYDLVSRKNPKRSKNPKQKRFRTKKAAMAFARTNGVGMKISVRKLKRGK